MAIDVNKLKQRAADLAYQVKEWALNVLDDFRRQTKYFKARVGVISGFAALVALTFLIAPAPSVSNPIDAVVRATSIPWGVRNKTIVEVFNGSGDDYENLIVIIEGTELVANGQPPRAGRWKYTSRKLREGQRMQVEAKHLVNEAGDHPVADFAPTGVEIRCSDGVYKDKLALRNVR